MDNGVESQHDIPESRANMMSREHIDFDALGSANPKGSGFHCTGFYRLSSLMTAHNV